MRNLPVDPVADRRSRPHKILYNRQSISAAATDFKPIALRLHVDRGVFDSFPGHPAIVAWGFINIQIVICRPARTTLLITCPFHLVHFQSTSDMYVFQRVEFELIPILRGSEKIQSLIE